MINTYETYLKQPDALKMEDALRIYTEMTECISKCSAEDKMEFWNEFLMNAAEYTNIRNRWETMSLEEKIEQDKSRSLCHEGFMTSLNIISRLAKQEDIDISWWEELGQDRKRRGDFACFVTYITGISNR